MTVGAEPMRHRILKGSGVMALSALHFGMQSEQGEIGAAVIERGGRSDLFPAACRMTTLAGPAERIAVGVLVAVGAGTEGHATVLSAGMTSLASDSLMEAGKRIASAAVVEIGHRFPGLHSRMT